MVGFTAMSQALPSSELRNLIHQFEARASDTVTDGAGRVVKLIGDEVMFVADTAETGCEVAIRLVEEFADDEVIPPVRGGLAAGPTLRQEGDYFGAVVNLAARATKVAPGRRVLVPETLTRDLAGESAFSLRRVGPTASKVSPSRSPSTPWSARLVASVPHERAVYSGGSMKKASAIALILLLLVLGLPLAMGMSDMAPCPSCAVERPVAVGMCLAILAVFLLIVSSRSNRVVSKAELLGLPLFADPPERPPQIA